MFPEDIDTANSMTQPKAAAVARYRRRIKRRGLVRLEVQVRKEDAPLVRRVASALSDPERGADTRALLRDRLAARPARGLKALLASAPLEGIDLERARDMGRDVEL
jgi:hypothetical protein